MTKFVPVLFAALLLTLGACASSPSYGPASSGGYGYTEQAIESDRYRVTYRGRSVAEADDGALRRAAEVTRMKGYSHFAVITRDLDRRQRSSGSSIGIGGSTGGRRSGVGVGVNVPLGGGSEDVTVRIEILMGNEALEDEPRSYDASAILTNLGGSSVN